MSKFIRDDSRRNRLDKLATRRIQYLVSRAKTLESTDPALAEFLYENAMGFASGLDEAGEILWMKPISA